MEKDNHKIVVFVRHGESTANVDYIMSNEIKGYPLTKAGISGAHAIGKELKGLKRVDNFYSSQLVRALQTADIISEYLGGMHYEVAGILNERGFGQYNGKRIGSEAALQQLDREEISNNFPTSRAGRAYLIECCSSQAH
jgi:broad specificity phosphatase PhoE